jgi:hypothetical protein
MTHNNAFRLVIFVFAILTVCTALRTAHAASDLSLSPDLSFSDDSSSNFPITGRDMSDGSMAAGQPTLIFFGTSHCWNTNREAERLVTLYPKYRDKIHIVVVDLNHASPAQQTLVTRYYRGYIPTITLIDSDGKVIYSRAGETASRRGNASNLESLIQSAK